MKFPEVDKEHFPQPDAPKEGQCEGAPNPLQAEVDDLRGKLDALQKGVEYLQAGHALDLAERDRRIQELEAALDADKPRVVMGDADPSRG